MQHIFGQGEDDRAGPTRNRCRISARDEFGNASRVVDPRSPFCDRAKEGRKVDFLEAFAAAHAAIYVADEYDHRLRILECDVNADAGIGGTGTAGDEYDAGTPRHRSIGTRHERSAAFLAAGHGLDRLMIVQGIEHGEKTLAGYGEHAVAALFDKAVDEPAGRGHWHRAMRSE